MALCDYLREIFIPNGFQPDNPSRFGILDLKAINLQGIENPGSKQITRPSTYLLVSSIKTHIIDVLKGDRFEARSTKALVPEDPLSKERMRTGRRGGSSVYLLRVIIMGFFYDEGGAGHNTRQGKAFVIFADVFNPIGRVGNIGMRHCRKAVKIVNAFD